MHDALPVRDCPFSWIAADRLPTPAAGPGRAASTQGWHQDHQQLGPARRSTCSSDIPQADQLVVCHGDTCAPDTLITDDGRWSGHVDLGELGLADRWADLAVATWSTEWNYGPGWSAPVDAYGIRPDPDRTHYYRLLWDLGPSSEPFSSSPRLPSYSGSRSTDEKSQSKVFAFSLSSSSTDAS